jgi:hypothetical protein
VAIENGGVERRNKPRISNPFRVAIRSVNVEGEAFTSETVLDNLSAGGMFLRLPQRVARGTRVFSVLCFSGESDKPEGLRVAISGVASRTEPGLHIWGVAVTFTRHRFL